MNDKKYSEAHQRLLISPETGTSKYLHLVTSLLSFYGSRRVNDFNFLQEVEKYLKVLSIHDAGLFEAIFNGLIRIKGVEHIKIYWKRMLECGIKPTAKIFSLIIPFLQQYGQKQAILEIYRDMAVQKVQVQIV